MGLKASYNSKSSSKLGMSLASSSLTLREDELNESRVSSSTFETQRKSKFVIQKLLLSNKFGSGQLNVPKNSKEAQFFTTI
jgi:hypothetical protein